MISLSAREKRSKRLGGQGAGEHLLLCAVKAPWPPARRQRARRPAEVLDVRTGRVVARLEKGNYSRSVAFSPDGELLAIGGYGGAARLVSIRTWKRMGSAMDGQEGRLTALEFSPDGRVLATVSADGTVLLWDVATPAGDRLAAAGRARRLRGRRVLPRRLAPVRRPAHGARGALGPAP
jgi:hypothetical protein